MTEVCGKTHSVSSDARAPNSNSLLSQVVLKVDMMCSGCSDAVERVLKKMQGRMLQHSLPLLHGGMMHVPCNTLSTDDQQGSSRSKSAWNNKR